ncbi:helix-turn-helix domain-containing protein [Paraglaciecola arctica]|nr:helix-turn-helix domain-containing protein [Paraglaciecola arctica]
MTQKISSFHFCTSALPIEHKKVAWRDVMHPFYQTSDQVEDAIFEAKVSGYFFKNFLCINAEADPQNYYSGTERALKSGYDGVIVKLILEGHCDFSGDASSIRNGAGGITILDMSREVIGITPKIDTINLVIPRHVLSKHIVNIESLHLQTLNQASVMTRLLVNHMTMLRKEAKSITQNEILDVSKLTIELVISALQNHIKTANLAPPRSENSLLFKIKEYICSNIQSTDLSVVNICTKYHISRAKLYRITEPLGGVASFIRKQRLQHAYRLVRSNEETKVQVSTIAFQSGFKSLSNFSLLFKEEFGISPSESIQLNNTYKKVDLNNPNEQPMVNSLLISAWLNQVLL